MRQSIQLPLSLILATLVGIARADVVYDNLANSSSTSADFNASSGFAQSFVNSAGTPAGISAIALNLFRTGAGTGTFTIQVWSATATKPTSKLATLLTANWADVSTSKTNPFTSESSAFTAEGQALQLAAGTTYWLAVVTGSSGPNFWALGANSSLGQVSSSGSSNPGSSAAWSDATTGSSLGGQITVSVPEPGTLALGATLLAMVPMLRCLKQARG